MDMHIMLTNQIKEIEKVNSTLNEYFLKLSIGDYDRKKLLIVVDEILSNVIYYGYEDEEEHIISLQLVPSEKGIALEFTDDGKYFDPLDFLQHHPIVTQDEKAGGLGLNLISKLMNHMDYQRKDNKNVFMIQLNYNSNLN